MTVKPHAIIISGSDYAKSFTDESSPDTRLTENCKVCVDGQVDRNLSLDWYYKVIQLFPDAVGELKSKAIVEQFKSFPSEVRDGIWKGLRRVKIHIVDPRPHRHRIDNVLRRSWGVSDAPQRLRLMVQEGLPYARVISDQLRGMVADSILFDSTAMRVQSLGRFLADPFFGSISPTDLPHLRGARELPTRQLVRADDFTKRAGLIGDVTSWSAKSSAAFHSALEAGFHMFEKCDATAYYADLDNVLRTQMTKELLPVHAFDEGNAQHLSLLEDVRQSIIQELATRDLRHGLIVRKPGFVAAESKKSYYTQAADFAAGMASDLYGSQGLVGVVDRWEYVTYNGARASRSDAEEEMRKLAGLDV